MATRENESYSDVESEGDSLSSLKVIPAKTKPPKQKLSQRTFSTSEVDRETKTSERIVTMFMSCSPVLNNLLPSMCRRHAPLSFNSSESNIGVTSDNVSETQKPLAVSKSKRKVMTYKPTACYSPPVYRAGEKSPPLRPRSQSAPTLSEADRIDLTCKFLTNKEAEAAKSVGKRLCDIAEQIGPSTSEKWFEGFMLQTLSTYNENKPKILHGIFHKILGIVKGQHPSLTYQSIVDMLFYGRKALTQFLMNLEYDDVQGLGLVDQFVDFFNFHCLPWIRSHGGWREVLHHAQIVDLSVRTSGYGSMEQATENDGEPGEESDSTSPPPVFSSESDNEEGITFTTHSEPVTLLPPLHHSTPVHHVRQLSNIPESPVELPSRENDQQVNQSSDQGDFGTSM